MMVKTAGINLLSKWTVCLSARTPKAVNTAMVATTFEIENMIGFLNGLMK